MKVSVGQFAPSGSVAQNMATIARLAAEAKRQGGELLILPEESMVAVTAARENFIDEVNAGWPEFLSQLGQIADDNRIALIAGGYEPSGDHRPYNTLVAVNASGAVAGTYRKLHLFDAFSYQESKRIKPGDAGLSVVKFGDFSVGMMTCYDVRFPEQARALIEHDIDLLAVPSAWFKGEHKVDHWETLLKARAIENTVWLAAAGSILPTCIGHSVILDPMGIPSVFLTEESEAVVTTEVKAKRTEEVRRFLPVLKNRRITSTREITEAH